MTGSTDSFRNVVKYTGQDYRFSPSYIRQVDPRNGTDGTPFTSPDTKPKEQQGYYPIGSFWVNPTLNRIWVLTDFGLDTNNHTCAHWELLESSGITGVEQFLLPDTNIITPTGIPPQVTFTQGTGIQITQGVNSHTINIAAVGVGGAITGIHPNTFTGPGTDPVVPDGSGNVRIEGGATFATGTQANPIRTNSLAANTMDLQIQLAGSNAASSTANNFGVAQFDSNQFSVTSGFVQQFNSPLTGTATTVGAVTANINVNIPIPTAATTRVTTIRAIIAGSSNTNLGVTGELIGGIRNVGGVLTLLGPADLVKNNDSTLSAWSASVAISGTNALIQVLGVAGTTINWSAFIDIISVTGP